MNYKNQFCILRGGLISIIVSSILYAAPNGGTVVSGSATINQSGNTTNINQSSNKAIINWQDFSIKSNETVNFNQPNQNSITLNRVVGNEKSIIDGALNANGQVWIINSNGVLFGKNAKVNTAGILASTKDISNENFNNGNYNFKGNSTASILNEGEIKSLEKTHATFIANSVTNNGKIEVHKGVINLVGASEVTLSLNDNSNISLKVNKGVLNALVENNNLLVANGGNVYLTTNAKDELLKSVINNKGIIEANSLDNLKSEVILFAHGGTANIDGNIIAKGSFVETSADKVKVANNFRVIANKWLIDPTDFTIDATSGDISGATLSNNLANTDVIIQSTSGTVNTNGNGNIYVNDEISWSSPYWLSLQAQNDIFINKTINVDGVGHIELKYGQSSLSGLGSDYYFGKDGKINFATSSLITQRGTDSSNIYSWNMIRNATDLQNIVTNDTTKKYAVANDIDLSSISNWTPIGANSGLFSGTFEGLGHSISNLTINKPNEDYVGLFKSIEGAAIQNLSIKNANIKGKDSVGVLAGNSITNSRIRNVSTSGVVNGNNSVGGLIGVTYAKTTIKYSNSSVIVNGNRFVGGLVGSTDDSYIGYSSATGNVIGTGDFVGGLVGFVFQGDGIEKSFATGNVTGSYTVGGLAGRVRESNVDNSYATGNVDGTHMSMAGEIGGLVGSLLSFNSYSASIRNSYATGNVTGNTNSVGSLTGTSTQFSKSLEIDNSYATGKIIVPNSDKEYTNGLLGRTSGLLDVTNSFYDKTINQQFSKFSEGLFGKTTAELQNIATFNNWNIVEDSTLTKSTPILAWQKDRKDYVWIIGTKTNPINPTNPNVEQPQNKDPKKVVENIQQITNSSQISTKNYLENTQNDFLTPNQNQNPQTLALNNNMGVSIINGGIKMPEQNSARLLNEDEK